MHCESCNSENTQRLEVVFENGTQNINTKSHTFGTSLFNPLGGLFGASTSTKGTSMSSAAKKAAPPTAKNLGRLILVIVIAVIVLFNASTIMVGIIAIAAIAGAGFWVYKNFMYNKKTFPPLYDIWLDSWICNKCGSTFRTPTQN